MCKVRQGLKVRGGGVIAFLFEDDAVLQNAVWQLAVSESARFPPRKVCRESLAKYLVT